jgi:hypothetical protein
MPATAAEPAAELQFPWRETRRRLGSGLLRLCVASLLLGAAWLLAAPLWFGAQAAAPAPPAVPIVLAAAGLGVMLWALDALLDRVQVTLESGGVTFERRGLRRAQAWSEPYEAYRGLLARADALGVGLRYAIVLKHAKDTARDVTLHSAPSPAGQRARLTAFAQRLGLPVLIAAPRGYAAIGPNETGRLLAAQLRRDPPAAPASPLVSGPVRSVPRAEGYAFRQWKGGRAMVVGSLCIAVGLALLAGLGGIEADGGGLWNTLASHSRLIVLPLGLALLAVGARLNETLEVDPTGVRACLVLGHSVLRETVLAGETIDAVQTEAPLGVLVVSDPMAIQFAAGVPEPVLRSVSAAVLATLARGSAALGLTQVARLRKFAAAAFATGLGPDQVHVKLSELGAPVEDVDACLHAIAEDRRAPYAGLMRAYLKLAQPAAARSAAPALALPPIAAPGVALGAPRGRRGLWRMAAGVAAVLMVIWLAAPLITAGARRATPWVPTTVLAWLHDATRAAGQADYATAKQIVQGFADFEVSAAQGTRFVLFGARRVRSEKQGRHLRVVVEGLRMERKDGVARADFTAIGIVVAPREARRNDQWVPAYDFGPRGTLSAETPVAELPEQTFVVPTMADSCAGGCQARLLLQVRVGPGEPFTENSPIFALDPR